MQLLVVLKVKKILQKVCSDVGIKIVQEKPLEEAIEKAKVEKMKTKK
jgi:hypothetical protein